eukprot:4988532-Pleurochrysis_carterae.AAC.5
MHVLLRQSLIAPGIRVPRISSENAISLAGKGESRSHAKPRTMYGKPLNANAKMHTHFRKRRRTR